MGNNQIVQHGNFLLIDVPEDAKSFLIKDHLLFYEHSFDKVGLGEDEIINLKTEKYSLVGIASSLTEEQWKGIVEEYIYSGKISFYAYKDYTGKIPECEDDILSATESGLSLLAAHGKKPSTTLIITKNE